MTVALDPDAFRSVLGRFASGVTILTTVDRTGRHHGMTVSAFASLSLNPPLVVACVDRAATMFDVLQHTKHFVVNILADRQEPLSRRFADLDASARFDGVGFTPGVQGAAILDEVLAWLECDLVALRDGGDHGLFIGQVQRAESREAHPLLYYRGGYARLER